MACKQENLAIQSSTGNSLSAVLHSPSKASRKAVIVCHGLTGRKDEKYNIKRARTLCSKGYTVMRFDFSGHGQSQGKLGHTTLTREIRDLDSIVSLMKAKGFKRIGLLGHSFGGTVALLYAAKNPSIKAVAMSGSPVILTGKDSSLQQNVKAWLPKMWKNYSRDVREKGHDLLKQVKKLKQPLLIIHGSRDRIILSRESKLLYSKAREPKKLVIIKGIGHDITPIEPKALREAIEWFGKHL